MMRKSSLLLLAALFVVSIGAAPSAGVASLLHSYGVSSSFINASTATNITFSGSTYALVRNGGVAYFLVNTTSAPSFVLNSTTIARIISPTLESASTSLNFTPVAQELTRYLDSSVGPLNDCLAETGLNMQTCTVANNCQSCRSVPACGIVPNNPYDSLGGATGAFAGGIMAFAQQYSELESNVSIADNYSMRPSGVNASAALQSMGNAINNIAVITQSMGDNPIFPPLSSDNFGLCVGFPNTAPTVAQASQWPWYCGSVGLCEFLSYNTTQLNVVESEVSALNALLPTPQKISQLAQNISANQDAYVLPTLTKQKAAAVRTAVNVTLIGLPALLNSTSLLLTHAANATVLAEEAALQSNYTNLKQNYISLNVTLYASTLAGQQAALHAQYLALNASYNRVLAIAHANTALLIAAQLNGDHSNQTAALAFRQQQYNAQLSGQLSSLPAAQANLSAISAKLPTLSAAGLDLSPEALVRAVDGPFVTFLSSAAGTSYFATVQSAPLVSSLLSLIIGLVILALVFVQYLRLKARSRLRLNQRTSSAWRIFFAIAFILVLVYVGITYVVASAANTTAPSGAFSSALHASHSVVIAINGTSTAALTNCAGQVTSAAQQYNYTATTIDLVGSTCTGTGVPENASQCLNQYARTNVPVVLLSQSNQSSVNVYSFYGTMLRASGTAAFMNACYASFLIR